MSAEDWLVVALVVFWIGVAVFLAGAWWGRRRGREDVAWELRWHCARRRAEVELLEGAAADVPGTMLARSACRGRRVELDALEGRLEQLAPLPPEPVLTSDGVRLV